jgi:hypothetical protein
MQTRARLSPMIKLGVRTARSPQGRARPLAPPSRVVAAQRLLTATLPTPCPPSRSSRASSAFRHATGGYVSTSESCRTTAAPETSAQVSWPRSTADTGWYPPTAGRMAGTRARSPSRVSSRARTTRRCGSTTARRSRSGSDLQLCCPGAQHRCTRSRQGRASRYKSMRTETYSEKPSTRPGLGPPHPAKADAAETTPRRHCQPA